MTLPRTVAAVIGKHVTLELQCIDRMYLNVYQPKLQLGHHVFRFLREQRGAGAVSSLFFQQMTCAFVNGIEAFAQHQSLPLITFEKKQRKDDVAAKYRADFQAPEGIYLIGKAQEKAKTYRTEGRRNPTTGQTYPWLVQSTAMVNQYYFYGLDADFGPFFLKFSSYFPYGAKLCINGHEYLKRQLAKEGIGFEELDNGIASCVNRSRMQQLADGLSHHKIDGLLRKWLARLPHPFQAKDRAAGFRYELSILQAEFSLTQVFDRPVAGRIFFEEVIRDNLDLGRPDNVQLIFDRRVTKKTPGRFRTRVITDGVLPSLHVDYKSSRIKQYLKHIQEHAGLRTETTVNDTYDFGIGRGLHNLPALRELGFQANRRLLDVQKTSHDCLVGEVAFREVTSAKQVGKQRVSGMAYADPLVLVLFQLLLLFRLLPCGFRNKELRPHLAQLLGKDPSACTQGQLTYQLRRLRLHGLIERQPQSHRYRVTDRGLRIALFFTRSYARLVRPGLAIILANPFPDDPKLTRAFNALEHAMDQYAQQAKI
jgi:hypothetical protein